MMFITYPSLPFNLIDEDPRMSSILPSPRRACLASLENAYAVAVRIREASGVDQFVVGTGNPMQPFRVAAERPAAPEMVLALVA
ncbi:hypothetical protein [Sphingomonas xinjiangensis]|uniref:Uncharacterized protein n=1 Tax=Sphingomonas xinjiangensis TaxID=643568 RepID=A0A840YRU6_9SPHN|nr:hypothetical protein [Sphingomonas xinjiangensis]MBB5712391.1 hypothetical protein [Sphingomonas xinjiangensis]